MGPIETPKISRPDLGRHQTPEFHPRHTMVIAGTDAEGAAVQIGLALTVTDVPSTAGTSSSTAAQAGGLASTGANGTALLSGGALLLLIGGSAAFAATRRKAAKH